MPVGRRCVGRSFLELAQLLTPGKEPVADEAHVPAEQPASEADARLPRPYGDTRRAKCAETAPSQGPEAADRPGATEVRAAIVSALAASARIMQLLRSQGGERIEVRKGPPFASSLGVSAGAATRQTPAERELSRRFPHSIAPRSFAIRFQRKPPRRQRCGAKPGEATSSGIRAPSPPRPATGPRFRRHRQARRGRTLLCGAGRRVA
jgi:hypothetical protein